MLIRGRILRWMEVFVTLSTALKAARDRVGSHAPSLAKVLSISAIIPSKMAATAVLQTTEMRTTSNSWYGQESVL